MALPVTIPNAFANATASIPLSQLDTNFNTLANAVNGISDGSETLANVTATVANITTANVGALNTSGQVVFNDAGADVDFRVEGDTNANLLFVDASTDRVGVGTNAPAVRLDVQSSGNDVLSIKGSSSATFMVIDNASLDDYKIGGVNSIAPFVVYNDTDARYEMVFDGTGNLGIGTTSPFTNTSRTTLTVDSSAAGGGEINLGVQGTKAVRLLTDGSYGLTISADPDNSAASSAIYFNVDGTERARITSGGQFLLGTTVDLLSGGKLGVSQSANAPAIGADSTFGAFTRETAYLQVNRSASSVYSFLVCVSGSYSDTEFNLRGDGNGYADGTWNNNGADYAEYFESVNGEALTLGATVVLDGNKVREATEQDSASAVIGVVRPKEPSKASMVIGNTAWNKWANKYLTDDFDRYIMEDHHVVEWEEQVLEKEATEAVEAVVDEDGNEVSPAIPAQEATYKTISHSYESHNIPEGITVPEDATVKTHDDKGNKFQHYKLNPEWNPDSEYVNRENRAEWNIIGLLGQVKILKGQPVGDRWIKMRDISETVEEWFIR